MKSRTVRTPNYRSHSYERQNSNLNSQYFVPDAFDNDMRSEPMTQYTPHYPPYRNTKNIVIKRREKQPQEYDGKTNFRDFVMYFE